MIYHDNLTRIATDLKQGEGVNPVTVRELLGWFGAARRGVSVVADIRDAFAHHGLRTVPDFERVYIDSHVTFAPAAGGCALPQPTPGAMGDAAYRVSRLRQANMKVLCVQPDTALRDAITHMRVNDYSQLPVVDDAGRARWIVNWRCLGQRLLDAAPVSRLEEVMQPAITVQPETSIFDAIALVGREDAVVVVDGAGKPQGIITAQDLGEQFQDWTRPFLLLEEIETGLRRRIDARVASELIASVAGKKSPRVTTAAGLMFGQYVLLLEKPDAWSQFGCPLSQEIFCARLDKVRRIRNQVMHFDPDGLDEADLRLLATFSGLVRGLG